jgi:hypothetical protein
MPDTPIIYKYIRVRTGQFGENNIEPSIFAFKDEVIITADEFQGQRYPESKVYDLAVKVTKAANQKLYRKDISFKDSHEYADFIELSSDCDPDAILTWADYDWKYIFELDTEFIDYNDISLKYSGDNYSWNANDQYSLTEEDQDIFESIAKKHSDIPADAINSQIETFRQCSDIRAMAIWTEDLISESLAANGYTDCLQNIDIVTEEIEYLIGTGDKHRDFILQLAIDRCISNNKILN